MNERVRQPQPRASGTTGDAIARARKAMATDARAAIDLLLTAWRATRAPELADAIDRLSEQARPPTASDPGDALELPRTIDRLREGPAAAALGVLLPVRATDDPRVAAALVRMLEDPPWHATGSQPFWRRLFELLDDNVDPRTRPRLEAIRYGRIIKGKTMRGWLQKRVAELVDRLATDPRAAAGAALDKADTAALATLQARPAAPRRASRSGGSTEAELLNAVYESPYDDAPRLVLADYLIEREDPRGELIALQLRPTASADDAALKLLRKHRKVWVGALSPYVKYFQHLSVAPVDPLSIHMWWRGGFLAGCIVSITKPKLAELADNPGWSTLERVSSLYFDAGDDVDGAVVRLCTRMRALRVFDGTTGHVVELAATTPAAGRLETVDYYVDDEQYAPSVEALATMPQLRAVRINLRARADRTLRPVFDAKLLEHPVLERFAFSGYGGTQIVLQRPAGKRPWTLALEGADAASVGLVAELVAARVPIGGADLKKTRKSIRQQLEKLVG